MTEGLEQRMQNDAEYAAFREAAINMPESSVERIPCDGTNSVVIPLAFHFDASFTCADPTCLLTKVQEQIDVLNAAFGDNSVVQQNIDLDAVCPTGYPLSVVSTGTCIEFKLAVPPAGQGLDPACDPAITIGQFSGGLNGGGNGAGAAWAGYLNVFVVEEISTPVGQAIGVADGIPGMANGDGVTLIADAFGGIGPGCNSGNDIDVGATDGTIFFFTEGGTTVHEIGHYLGLYHIWGDDAILGPLFECLLDDNVLQSGPFFVNDTPLQGGPSATNAPCPTLGGATCASLPATCDGSNDYFHNYMDYSNDVCMSMFTNDQSIVMNYWANQLFGGSTIGTFNTAPATLTTLCQMVPCAVCAGVNLDIDFDGFPGQTSWEITDANTGGVVVSGGTYGGQAGNSTLNLPNVSCLPDGCYELTFYDAVGNGMCPFRATASSSGTFITPGTLISPGATVATLGTVVTPGLCGNYTLTDANGTTLASGGGSFGNTESSTFCLSGGIGSLWEPDNGSAYSKQQQMFTRLEVFPTLASNYLFVNASEMLQGQINIVDTNGQIIKRYQQNEPQMQLNVSDLPAGIYFVQIVAGDTVLVEKFVKQ